VHGMKGAMTGVVVCGLAAVLVTGCGGPGVDMATVNGKVTVAGQPVKDITVTFTPESGRPATGVTDANGNYTLSSFSAGDGAMPGKYTVAFSVATSDEPPPSDQPPDQAPPPLPFNAKYLSGATSGITAEVVAGKTNEMPTWDLEK
jgi:hypothetical protein